MAHPQELECCTVGSELEGYMTKKELLRRIEDLERRVAELEARPLTMPYPVWVAPPQPSPTIPVPYREITWIC